MTGTDIFNLIAALALGIMAGFGAFAAEEALADKYAHRRIREQLMKRFLINKPFASEELIDEASKIMHDESESEDARDFAKRVYIIGKTAQAAADEYEDDDDDDDDDDES